MKYRRIQRVAVIGSGTMGSALAAMLVGAGFETALLDIPAEGSTVASPPAERNAVLQANLQRSLAARPTPWYSEADVGRIRCGNLEDDQGWLTEVDWVLEAAVEELAVKQALMGRLNEVCGPRCVISSNTSGLPLARIAEGLPASFTRRFLGTHFFNPPRYLALLELIPHEGTDAAVLEFMQDFCSRALGKDVVVCRDVPGFLGNRFLSALGMQAIGLALDEGYSVSEVDVLTGPLIGRPRTATFGLQDLVGLDVALAVAQNLQRVLPESAMPGQPGQSAANALFEELIARGRLGRKSGGGFWQQRRGPGGQRERLALNLQTLEYEAATAPQFESVAALRAETDLGARMRQLPAVKDRAGRFLRQHLGFMLGLAAACVPEVTDSPLSVDRALRWGFNHEAGPFEVWDALGLAGGVALVEEAGYDVANWVRAMPARGCASFYQRDASGAVVACYDPQAGDHAMVQRDARALRAADFPVQLRNAGASLRDMGDGVTLWDFHSAHNSIDDDVIENGHDALEQVAAGRYRALVIGTDGARFSIGYNLALALARIEAGEFDKLARSVRRFQQLTRELRRAPVPVVAAAAGMALGGGAEVLLAADQVIAHSELLAGLVEFNVGLVPAGGGCVALLRCQVTPTLRSCPEADVLPTLRRVFAQLLDARMIPAAALEAREQGLLRPQDRVIMRRAQLLHEAKRAALHLTEGYRVTHPETQYAAGRGAYEALLAQVTAMERDGELGAGDAQVARRLAYVLTGGAPAKAAWIDEGELFELELAAFMALAQEPHTQACIRHMLRRNRPLRYASR